MNQSLIFWLLVVAISSLSGLGTFLFVYLFWLRSVMKRLMEVQTVLGRVSATFVRQGPVGSNTANNLDRSQGVTKLQMCVEGKDIDILEINGQEVVRFQGNVTEDEKNRIIEYLRIEGFLNK